MKVNKYFQNVKQMRSEAVKILNYTGRDIFVRMSKEGYKWVEGKWIK